MIIEQEWLTNIRNKAQEEFLRLPFPQEREEEWRYTNLPKINFISGDSEIMMDGDDNGIIFTDLISATRTHTDLVKKHLGNAVKINDKFSAFHYANLANGVFIFVPDNKSARLSSRITGGGHTIIITGKNSKLEYLEEYTGGGFTTNAVEIFAGENSKINFASVQNCDSNAVVFSFKEAILERNSNANFAFGSFGGTFHRVKANTALAGEGATSETLCMFRGNKKQHTDFTVNSHHLVPHTKNNILSKGVVTDEANAVFRGLIRIEKGAQQTDSYLSGHTLILSETANSNSIPSLQIEANDVKASHGATVGQIDEEQLFYLMSRGLSREDAEHIIVDGFFEPILDKISNKIFQEKFRTSVIR